MRRGDVSNAVQPVSIDGTKVQKIAMINKLARFRALPGIPSQKEQFRLNAVAFDEEFQV